MKWWRRNALALAALALLIPGAVVVIGGQEWITYYGFRPISPIDVREGESADFAGATFGPARVSDGTATQRERIPNGARILVAEIPVQPGAESPGCTVTLRETTGQRRHWEVQPNALDRTGHVSCTTENSGRYVVEAPFLVPADATGPFAIELVVAGQQPRFLRLIAP